MKSHLYQMAYQKHYERMGNKLEVSKTAYRFLIKCLPPNKDINILEIGCGWGDKLLLLYRYGYKNLTGVDVSKNLCEIAKKQLPKTINIFNENGLDFIKKRKGQFDLILLFDLIEHIPREKTISFLKDCYKSLRKNGSIIIRTPNMSTILSSHSLFIDFTHLQGFTQWSLFYLLDMSGFKHHKIIKRNLLNPNWKRPWSIIDLKGLLNNFIHKMLFFLRRQKCPDTFDKNIIVQSFKN